MGFPYLGGPAVLKHSLWWQIFCTGLESHLYFEVLILFCYITCLHAKWSCGSIGSWVTPAGGSQTRAWYVLFNVSDSFESFSVFLFSKTIDIDATNNLKQYMNDLNEKGFYAILLLWREFLKWISYIAVRSVTSIYFSYLWIDNERPPSQDLLKRLFVAELPIIPVMLSKGFGCNCQSSLTNYQGPWPKNRK